MLAIYDYLFVIIYRVNLMLANCTNMSVCKLTTGWNIINVIVPVKAVFRLKKKLLLRFSFFETVEKVNEKLLLGTTFLWRFTKSPMFSVPHNFC